MAAPRSISTAGTVRIEEAAALCGYSVENLYLISQRGTYFSPPINALYDTADLLQGMVRYIKDQHAKQGGTMEQIKLQTNAAKMRVAKVNADIAELKVLPVEEVDRMNGHYLTEIVQRAAKLGPSVGMLTVGGTAQQNAAIFQDGLLGVFSDLPRMKMLDEDSKKKIHHWLHTKTESVSG